MGFLLWGGATHPLALNKNHDFRRDLCCVSLTLRRGFADRFDALGAQNFMNLVSLFHHDRFLQVGPEGTIGGAHGE